MTRVFNVTGSCDPNEHYMVDITEKLIEIKKLVDAGAYFTINRARQYGKTTTLNALADYLKDDYIVLSLDFQKIGYEEFENAVFFSSAFADYLVNTIKNGKNSDSGLDAGIINELSLSANSGARFSLRKLFNLLSRLCSTAKKPVILMIDEVDSATNNQVFLDFLAQLRSDYLDRKNTPTFQSVILAGVYDIKNMKRKLRADEDHKVNSPWNIATEFTVNMSFSKNEIAGMLREYEADYHTGMDTDQIAGLIFDSTAGYPFLVSRFCKLIDEKVAGTEPFPDKQSAWTKSGFIEAEKMLVHEKNTLFDSLTGKLLEYPDLKRLLSAILFEGRTMSFAPGNPSIEIAAMLGFVKNINNTVAVSNRIFEIVLYNQLLAEEEVNSAVYAAAQSDKNQFIRGGRLNMKLVLERFVVSFTELYGDLGDTFKEEMGRKYFMLFLKPIINGTGHCYVEAQTRNMRRTDIIVDYRGEQFIVELKIWHGPKYHADGEQQLSDYLDYYNLKKGYLLTFNFSQAKKVGVVEKQYGDRVLVEATV